MGEAMGTIVIGGGAMGSSAAWHLARRAADGDGAPVTLIEQLSLGHDRGSSHGESRIIRLTYHAPTYVRLAREAYILWEALEREAGEVLYRRTGDLFFGEDGGTIREYERVLAAEDVAFDRLDAAGVAARFPAMRLGAGERALFQAEGGVLSATRCVLAQARAARRLGARILENERVIAIDRSRDPLVVATDKGEHRARRLVVAAGAWLGRLLPELGLPLVVTRQEVCTFAPPGGPEGGGDASIYRLDRMPVWVRLGAGATADDIHFYGFPMVERFGLKLARFAARGAPGVSVADADRVERGVSKAAIEATRAFLGRHIPGAAGGALIDAHVCLFTMTPDEDFVIDAHPADPRIAVGSPCSGHGFKFASAIGKALAEIALDGRTRVRAIEEDRGRFAIGRFRAGA